MDERDPIPGNAGDAAPCAETDGYLRPMSGGLMARLFVVPAVIVCLLIAVAVVVVLFGTTSMEKPRTVSELLTILSRDRGERTFGYMLLPEDKEYWQAAQELARRLEDRDKVMRPEEIEPAAATIVSILERFPPGQDTSDRTQSRQHFLMMALARTGSPTAVAPLAKLARDPNSGNRIAALKALAEMRTQPAVKQAMPDVLRLLDDPKPEVQLVACAATGAIAATGDAAAIAALADKLEADRELQWNAAMALARLGSARGKLVLMNMLDREFWTKSQVSYDEGGTKIVRPFTTVEIANNMCSAITAAAALNDRELDGLIEKLQEDPAPQVKDAAVKATEHRKTGPISSVGAREKLSPFQGSGLMPLEPEGLRPRLLAVAAPRLEGTVSLPALLSAHARYLRHPQGVTLQGYAHARGSRHPQGVTLQREA